MVFMINGITLLKRQKNKIEENSFRKKKWYGFSYHLAFTAVLIKVLNYLWQIRRVDISLICSKLFEANCASAMDTYLTILDFLLAP